MIEGLGRRLLFRVPRHLVERQAQVDERALRKIEQSIRENFHRGWRASARYSAEGYEGDLDAHVSGRLLRDRERLVPWLDSVKPLLGMRILEIGCGTGSSTVALAEQGATVVGIDVDESALEVARERCRAYRLTVDLRLLNASEVLGAFSQDSFDLIIFFAALEHMTVHERLASLAGAWEILPGGGSLAIVDTPNRLWFFDGHTSFLPFFHWLPDDLAIRYSRFSSRENFHELYLEVTPTAAEHFARRGRGVSFHEVDLAIGRSQDLLVTSSLSSFAGPLYALRLSRLERRFGRLLRSIYPKVDRAFLERDLNLVIEKGPRREGVSAQGAT